ncbi:MAG: RadC family protein [Nanobdellota archaeon]
MQTMKELPWFIRPWHKIKENGIEYLDDSELLSVIFVKGNNGTSSLDLSRKLLERYNLTDLNSCSLDELTRILGRVKAYQMMSLGELMKRHSKLKRKGFRKEITKPEDVYNMFYDDMKGKKREHFYALFLDTKNRVIKKELISVGTLNQSIVHPRDVFREAIRNSAASIILMHNHPSGDPQPSEEDRKITEVMKRSGELIGIKVLDHIVIGEWFSHA